MLSLPPVDVGLLHRPALQQAHPGRPPTPQQTHPGRPPAPQQAHPGRPPAPQSSDNYFDTYIDSNNSCPMFMRLRAGEQRVGAARRAVPALQLSRASPPAHSHHPHMSYVIIQSLSAFLSYSLARLFLQGSFLFHSCARERLWSE